MATVSGHIMYDKKASGRIICKRSEAKDSKALNEEDIKLHLMIYIRSRPMSRRTRVNAQFMLQAHSILGRNTYKRVAANDSDPTAKMNAERKRLREKG